MNNELCMIRTSLNYLNRVQLNYYSFLISLEKFNKRCNVVDDSSAKICASNET